MIFIDKNIVKVCKSFEQQTDRMVYKLYNLTYEEVKVTNEEIEKKVCKEEYKYCKYLTKR